MTTYKGRAASEGIAVGRIVFWKKTGSEAERRTIDDTDAEIARFEQAKEHAKSELAEIYEKALEELGEAGAAIFEVHRMLLDDLNFVEAVTERIEREKVNAEYAVEETCGQFSAMFETMDNEYMRAREADVKDIADRVIAKLMEIGQGIPEEKGATDGAAEKGMTDEAAGNVGDRTAVDRGSISETGAAGNIKEPAILVAEDLAPSELMQFGKSGLLAVVTRGGSVNSHTAILARTMGIPALTGVGFGDQFAGDPGTDPLRQIDGPPGTDPLRQMDGLLQGGEDAHHPETDPLRRIDGRTGIVDGYAGVLFVDPDEATRKEYDRKQKEETEELRRLSALRDKETVTKDGRKIRLGANIGCAEDAEAALKEGAEEIGLFRTEFLFLGANDLPGEEEQFEAYRAVAEKMAGKRVVIRTLDIGADKSAAYFGLEKETNPALGYRGIRLCLDRTDLFKTQLRAILRAACYGNVAVMYPMIISLDELRRAKRFQEEVKAELDEKKIPHGEVAQGIMVETPAAVWLSEELAKEADFFSIGTNDLTQYMLAIDRQNPRLDAFCDPHHPAVLGAIRTVVENAHKSGIWAGICGELAADTTLAEKFLRMGADELSVSPSHILAVRAAVRSAGNDKIHV